MNLTPRQQQVVALVRDGHTYADIADALGIARATVQRHVIDARRAGAQVGRRRASLKTLDAFADLLRDYDHAVARWHATGEKGDRDEIRKELQSFVAQNAR